VEGDPIACQPATFDACAETELLFECFNRLLNPEIASQVSSQAETLRAGLPAAVEDETLEAVSAALAGDDAGALLDLLPTFLGALGFDGMDDSDGDFVFERPVVLGENSPLRLVLGGKLLLRPELFSPLEKALDDELAADVASARESALEDDLEPLDSFDLQARLALERKLLGRLWGRDYGDYTGLFQAFFEEIGDQADSTAAMQEGLQRSVNAVDPGLAAGTAGAVRALAEPERQEVIDAFDAALAEQCRVADAMNRLRRAGYDRFGDLIANQPQLVLTGRYSERDPLTGPDEVAITARLEVGLGGNVNDF
jgi:hypothetical protein